MESFKPIDDINHATLLSVLGCPIKYDKITDVRSGKAKTSIYVPSITIPKVMVKGEGGKVEKAGIITAITSGALAKLDPHHHALDCARSILNRERLLDWLKKGTQQQLFRVDGVNRCVYVPTNALTSDVLTCREQWPTQDIKLAASMALIGVPVVRIVGTGASHTFYLSRYSIGLTGDRLDGLELARQLMRKELAKEHPLSWAMQTLVNRDRILDRIHDKPHQLYIKRRNSPRNAAALIEMTDDRKKLDQKLNDARKHCGSF